MACHVRPRDAGKLPMAYGVRWQLVGRSGQPLDNGCLGAGFCAFGDAVAAVIEFLRPYPDVCHCPAESYWLARRSVDADLAVWVWIEQQDTPGAPGQSAQGFYEAHPRSTFDLSLKIF
jgi:hypothetical protein